VTQWGMLLLCVYIALGVSRASWRKAGRLAVVFTVIVIGIVMAQYTSKTPKLVISPLNGTNSGNLSSPAQNTDSANSEDTTGRDYWNGVVRQTPGLNTAPSADQAAPANGGGGS
jgi:hypothetical protein